MGNPYVNSKGSPVTNYIEFKAYAKEIASKWRKIENSPEKTQELLKKYYETIFRNSAKGELDKINKTLAKTPEEEEKLQEKREEIEKKIQSRTEEKVKTTPEPLKTDIIESLKRRDVEELNYVIKELLVEGGASVDDMKELFGDKFTYKKTDKELEEEGITLLKKADKEEQEKILQNIITGNSNNENAPSDPDVSNKEKELDSRERRFNLKKDAVSSNLNNLNKIFSKIEELHKCDEDDYDLNRFTVNTIQDAKEYVIPKIKTAQKANERSLKNTAFGKKYTLSLGFKQRSKVVAFNKKYTPETLEKKLNNMVPKYERILETDDAETIEEKQFKNYDTISTTLKDLSQELNETIDKNRKDITKQGMSKAEKAEYLKARQYRQQHLNFTAENPNEFEEIKISGQDYSDIAKTLKNIDTTSRFEVQDKSRFLFDLNRIHDSRGLLSIIFHPINYYREGKMLETVKTDLKGLGLTNADIKELVDMKKAYNAEKYKGIDNVKETFSLTDTKLNKSENQDLNKKQGDLTNDLKAVTNDKPLVENNKDSVKQEQKKEIKEPEQNIKPIGKNK